MVFLRVFDKRYPDFNMELDSYTNNDTIDPPDIGSYAFYYKKGILTSKVESNIETRALRERMRGIAKRMNYI